MLLVGPTGVGKSTFALQAMLQWAMGKPFMGMEPTGPLKSLLIQAENDDGDLAEMRDGVVSNLEFTQVEWDQTSKSILTGTEAARTRASFIYDVVAPLIEEHRPDLFWMDPVLAYLGGDANTQADVGGFLRNLLNPVLQEFECGGILLHHTNKPKGGSDRADWKGGELAYLGSGSAEWVNWSRAMMAIQGTDSWGLFKLIAAKRGGRLGWTDVADSPAREKWIRHSRGGGLHWIEVEECEAQLMLADSSRKPELRQLVIEDVLQHVKRGKPMLKKKLLEVLRLIPGMSRDRAVGGLEAMVEDQQLYEYEKPRSSRRPAVYIGVSAKPPSGMIPRP